MRTFITIALLFQCTLFAHFDFDALFENTAKVQEALLITQRDHELEEALSSHPSDPFSAPVVQFLHSPSKEQAEFFETMTPTSPLQKRVAEIFKMHHERLAVSKAHLLREGLVDIP